MRPILLIACLFSFSLSSTEIKTQKASTQFEDKFLGPSYKEIGRPGRGIFRSEDGLRQFRIDCGSITGKHAPNSPHVYLEAFKINEKAPWVRLSMKDSIKKYAHIDVDAKSDDELKKILLESGHFEEPNLKPCLAVF